ncbi:MAG: MarP family serine protease [Candidatus Limnocylindrales bacterium]
MDLFDVAVVVVLVLATWGGYRAGLAGPALGLLGAVAGLALVIMVTPSLLPLLDGYEQPWRAVLGVAGALSVVILGDALGSALGGALSRRATGNVLGVFDRVGGVVFGGLQAVLVIWLVGGLLASSSFDALATQAQSSATVRVLMGALPPPDEVIANIGGALDQAGLPDVFIGLEPLPASPAPAPDQAAAETLARLAANSTVRVDASACNEFLVGTAFAIGSDDLVTNAHVVAGASHVSVRVDADGRRRDATVIFFDPRLDVAVLRVPGLDLPALRWAAHAPDRGVQGAALGHPQGAPLAVVPAAVDSRLPARGTDIYGQAVVTRDVLELNAAVQPGDSGGPFVLPDGTVGGLVFAASRSQPGIGYALDPVVVASDIASALRGTIPAATGVCIT